MQLNKIKVRGENPVAHAQIMLDQVNLDKHVLTRFSEVSKVGRISLHLWQGLHSQLASTSEGSIFLVFSFHQSCWRHWQIKGADRYCSQNT